MDILVIQIILLIVTFVVTMLCLLLPLKVFPRGKDQELSEKSQRILSWSNCVSGGVFLGVCYIGLMPFVRDKFQQAFKVADIRWTYPLTEFVVILGFFLVLVTEQAVRSCKKANKRTKDLEEMIKYPMDYMIYSEDDSTGSDDSEAEAERRRMTASNGASVPLLKDIPAANEKNSKNINPTLTSGSKRSSNRKKLRSHGRSHSRGGSSEEDHGQGHGGHGHSHGGHGHSHSVDLTDGFSLRAAIMLLALSIHSLFEGMAVGLQDDMTKLMNLFISVLAHECLVCFAVGISLAKQQCKVSTLIKLSFLFCGMIPFGILVGMAIGGIHNFAGYLASAIIQAIAAGTFIYVIFMETLPSEFENDQDPMIKVVFIFIGFLLMACLKLFTDKD